MNTHAGRPIYCENCGKWLGSAANPPDRGAPTHMLCPDCLAQLARSEAPTSEAAQTARDEQPSGLVLLASAATAATAGLLALILRELRHRP